MGSKELEKILSDTNENGKFLAVLLTDHEGFPIASASSANYSPETQAALVGLVQRATGQATEQLGIAANAEFTMLDAEGNLFICHPFFSKGVEMVLSFLIPGRNLPYRRLMSLTINAIQQLDF
jgi:hypothetical protein